MFYFSKFELTVGMSLPDGRFWNGSVEEDRQPSIQSENSMRPYRFLDTIDDSFVLPLTATGFLVQLQLSLDVFGRECDANLNTARYSAYKSIQFTQQIHSFDQLPTSVSDFRSNPNQIQIKSKSNPNQIPQNIFNITIPGESELNFL